MLVEVNGSEHEVDTGRAALALVGPHEDVTVVHRRADGAVLRLTGTATRGFAIDVEGGHTGTRSSASRTVAASTVATMLDRFAAGETGWPGAIVWGDEATGARMIRRRNPVAGVVAMLVGFVVAVVAVALLRRAVTVPWLCGRDGRKVEAVRLGNRGLAMGRGDECEFVDGALVDVFDVGSGIAWAETAAALLLGLLVWYLATRVVTRLFTR